jgi:hypothetical protein
MATLTDEQRKSLQAQIDYARQQVNQLYAQRGQAPSGMITPNAAMTGGASGRGFEDQATQEVISQQVQNTTEQGRSVSQAGERAPATMSRSQAEFALRGAGLSGILDAGRFAGMNPAEAQRQIQAERAKRTGQVSALTSFAFNPETIAGTRKILDRVGIGINDINKDPFKSKGTQTDQIKSILEGGSREIASLFNSQQEFQQAMMSNPELQKTMQTFQAFGGNVDQIQNKIQMPQTQQPQTMQDYLGGISNPYANQEAEKMAMEEMFPERQVAQAEIARQSGIAQDMMNLYFGTEDQVGVLELKKAQADEQKRIIEQQQKDEKIAIEKKARLAIDRNNADLQIQQAKIEENRLAAKNYMTGMLAKLGALQTTGAAPLALQTLETKYQNQSQLMESQFKFDNREIELGLDEAVNSLVTERDGRILKVEQDLTKDYEDIMKDIMKIEQASEKEIYRITEQFARRQRERTTKFTNDLQKEAEKYAKEFAKIAGGGIDLFSLAGSLGGTLGRASSKNAITSSMTNVKNDIRKNLPANVANKVLTDLNDEQTRLFLEDFLNERVTRQQSFDPTQYFEEWKKELGIKQPKESGASSGLSPAAKALLGIED